jgi:azobenzene reductase
MRNNILIINFSLRINSKSESHKVADYLQQKWGDTANLLNYIELDIPMWDEGVWDHTDKWEKILSPLRAKLNAASGYIFVVPEYAGSASPALANFNLFLSGESNHKPVLITTVSSSRGGAYPVTNIRAFAYKNSKVNYIPEHIIVRESEKVLNNEIAEDDSDKYIRDRIDCTLGIFDIYCTHFTRIRKDIVPNTAFGNGM